MIANLTVTLITLVALILAGRYLGRRVAPNLPPSTYTALGVSLALAWVAAGAVVGVLLGITGQLFYLAWVLPLVGLAVSALRANAGVLLETPVMASLGLGLAASLIMATPFVPEGQMDPGTIYEGRIPGRPPDNRLPYRTGQYILNELDLDTTRYFIDWDLTDRTQLSAAAASTIVGGLGVIVPSDEIWYLPASDTPWSAVDDYGYWAFRSVLIAFSALLPLGVAALAAPWFNEQVGNIAALIASMSVFSLTETLFTWPKYLAVFFAATGLGLLLRRRPALGGIVLGLGYLSHPVALLILAPGAVLVMTRDRDSRRRSLAIFLASFAAILAPWFIWTSLVLGETSRLILYPLGWIIGQDGSLSNDLGPALSAFFHRFPGGILTDRWISLRDSMDPFGLIRALSSSQPRGALFLVYDRTIPGLIGFGAIVPLVIGWWRSASVRAGLLVATVASLAAALAMWGVWPRALGADTLQPLIPFLAISAAVGLATVAWTARFVWLAACETFFVVDFTLFSGVDGLWRASLARLAYGGFLFAAAASCIRLIRARPDGPSQGPEGLDPKAA
ncbi:MAG TPA: hypothetical protein VJP78_13415 [Thermoleophilia bacterium]|nr:hypothetical protein [Thermoleophilia bacterium]